MAINQQGIETLFPHTPGSDIVQKLILQLSSISQFTDIFGPYLGADKNDQHRWADYQRFDWGIRQLPAICIFEDGDENKESDNAFMTGNVHIVIFWPPSQRRAETRRIEIVMKGALENFFASSYAQNMLDELYHITRPEKVYGLNELGRTLSWEPNTEGIIAGGEVIPVTSLKITYKIDLRAWYRALEYFNLTKENPFENSLNDLTLIAGDYQGSDDKNNIDADIPEKIPVDNT